MESHKGRVAIIGAGPAGLASALALTRQGFEVALFERHREIKAAGNILNLWPAPQKVLQVLGVDTVDLGAASLTQLQRFDGHKRADFIIPSDIVEKYQGGFIGLLRWGLYKRMIDALPNGVLHLDSRMSGFVDDGNGVTVHFDNGSEYRADLLIGADGIESKVRACLWGDEPIRHHRLHLLGGFFFTDEPIGTRGVFSHDRKTQGSWTPIRHEGKNGYEWWVLEAWNPAQKFEADVKEYAKKKVGHFAEPLPSFIARTESKHTHRWEIRDRVPRSQWSRGRVTLVGDAAHPTSPYAAYGAGMSIEDGYFLGCALADTDVSDTRAVSEALQRFEDGRKPHTSKVTQDAYHAGKLFHHMPRVLRPVRDWLFDHTPLAQKTQGDSWPRHVRAQLDAIEDPEPGALRSL
ncbi:MULTISPECIES: FAD-dependent oxidoreductase [unclassified Rhodococcus (in: high G+C Gram-positive bacteria)]|uniref:FAD-dependent oxidoreductase n=1 Tax=unclassified Rhodococcus (in: high G+C Gram-positive bacteria) TaxID=192944 RepID=UPI0006F3CA67|nr:MULTISPECIES: NAD(P)/FAD-dependent oxidoreductase [unclassified Rhodococcus (in: high G+C Gram-positive bacteria)]KQU38440.1 salicylate hydroxylase [Rhodococcus sp. Leaf225]KQU39803.1 salicylate hydroxylase [Rhodococcus sp. Leaf258]